MRSCSYDPQFLKTVNMCTWKLRNTKALYIDSKQWHLEAK